MQVAALGGAEPGEFGACLHFATRSFDGFEFHVRKVAAVDNKVVAGVHVGGLQAAFKMFVGVESERHAELLAFVDGFFAGGKAYAQGVIGVGALNAQWNVACEVALLTVNGHENLADAKATCLFGGFQIKCVDAGFVTAAVAATAKERIEHVLDIGANYFVGTVEPHEGESVCRFDKQVAAVFREFIERKYELKSKGLARFDAFPVHLQGRPCLCAQGSG